MRKRQHLYYNNAQPSLAAATRNEPLIFTMDAHPNNPTRLKVSYYDGAVAFGGSLQVLAMLFSGIDRTKIDPKLIACAPAHQLTSRFADQDIGLLHKPRLHYAQRKQWLSLFTYQWARKAAAYGFSLASALANLPTQYRVYQNLKARRPDILHINNSYTPLFPAKILGIPVIWHLHGTPFTPSRWEWLLLRQVKYFVAISDHIAAQAITVGFPRAKIVTIQNPAPFATPVSEDIKVEIRRKYSIPDNHKLVAHIGRLIPWKGQLEFLKGIKVALQQYSDLTALIVGDDNEKLDSTYKKKLLAFVSDNNLCEKVRFTGQVENPRDFMAAADLVVHSSIAPEPFGLVIVEAMSTGTAVIASNLGAGQEIVKDGYTGVLVNPESAHELGQQILRLIKDDKERADLGQRGQSVAEQSYSLTNYSIRVSNLYNSIC